jgi:parvulin-like peptidyl-prolyl isomerase
MGKQVKARHILVKEKKEAREIYLRLKRGEKFEDIAKTESIDKRSGNNGGDLGWIRWGKMEPKFQRVAFKLKKGKFSRPVKTRYGWHIIKVDDIKKVEKKPFNEERKNIERALKRQEMRKLADGFLVHLKRIANIKYNEEIVTTIAKKSSGQGRTLPAVSPEEKKKIIARASFGAVTVGDFLDMANKNWRRPSFDKPENIKNFISNSLVYEKLLPMEAERHGLDKDPNVIKGLNEVKERLLIGTYMNKEISQKVEAPSDSELIAYYNAHKKDYKEEARAKTRIITCAKRDEIEKTRKKIIRGTDFSKIAKKFSTHRTKNSGGNLGWITRGKYPEIEKKAWTIRKGRVSRPFKVKEGYAIIKVEDRKPERIKEFKEVKNKINRELLNKRKEERKKELVEELKKKIKVEIYEKEG